MGIRRFGTILTFLGTFLVIVLFQNCGPDFKSVISDETSNSSVSENNTPEESVIEEPDEMTCELGFHLEDSQCQPDVMSCNVINGIGQQRWQGVSYGACEVVSCNLGYQNQSNVCVFSPSSCPVDFGVGETQSNGTCRILSCNSGYHLDGSRCVSNIQACTIPNGTGQRTWNGTSFGTCMALSCQTGYMLSSNQCVANPVVTNPFWGPRSTSRVFISGHSLTDDPLASYFVNIATQRGDSVAYNQQIIIGSPIRVRTRGSSSTGWTGYTQGKNRDGGSGLNIINELRSPQTIGNNQRYDTLVLAENHNSLEMIQWEDTIRLTRHYHDRIIEGNPSARTLFYNTWLDMNKTNPAPWIDHEKKALVAWECVASKVNLSLQAGSRNDRVLNLPVSAALVDLVERILNNQVPGITGTTQQRMNAIFSDNVHLTSLGVYYVSLVTYAGVYGKSPVGNTPPSGIAANTASELQSIAWFFVNSYFSQNQPGTRDMASCRSYISQQVCPSYWTLKGNTGNIANCQNYFSGQNSPFHWPDSSFVPYPAP